MISANSACNFRVTDTLGSTDHILSDVVPLACIINDYHKVNMELPKWRPLNMNVTHNEYLVLVWKKGRVAERKKSVYKRADSHFK